MAKSRCSIGPFAEGRFDGDGRNPKVVLRVGFKGLPHSGAPIVG
jgi:hypothetical protein